MEKSNWPHYGSTDEVWEKWELLEEKLLRDYHEDMREED